MTNIAKITCGECGNEMNLSVDSLRIGVTIQCSKCANQVVVIDRFVGSLGQDVSGEFRLIPDVAEIRRIDE
jgi:DNA-directed RNA polymerase subunit RPC12/RpoP